MPESTANAGPGSPLTDAELDAIEFANAATVGFPSATVDRLVAEVRRLRAAIREAVAAERERVRAECVREAAFHREGCCGYTGEQMDLVEQVCARIQSNIRDLP